MYKFDSKTLIFIYRYQRRWNSLMILTLFIYFRLHMSSAYSFVSIIRDKKNKLCCYLIIT